MNRGPDLEGDVRSAAHANRLGARLEPPPLPAMKVSRRILRIGLFEVQVLDVGLDARESPRDARVVPDDDAGDARQRRAGDGEARRLETREVPDGGSPQAEVGE